MEHPFSHENYLTLTRESQVVGSDKGWIENHITCKETKLISYIKSHSYGEYIFDFMFAQYYEKLGINYYPKLLHAFAFAPVTGDRIITSCSPTHDSKEQSSVREVVEKSFDFYLHSSHLHSEHYHFCDQMAQELKDLGFFEMLSHQFHFLNRFETFDDFLSQLKKSRRKMIKKERQQVGQYPLRIQWIHAKDLSENLTTQCYQLYASNALSKGSYPYLNLEYFLTLKRTHPEQALFCIAHRTSSPHQVEAFGLYFIGDQKLFGRNWGISKSAKEEFSFLHFEICIYQAIDYVLKHKLKQFEAGQGGLHKLHRGLSPVYIRSAHHFKIKQLHDTFKDFTQNQLNLEQQRIYKEYEKMSAFHSL